jgi:N-acetylglucosamine-6-phosphate deacetylase
MDGEMRDVIGRNVEDERPVRIRFDGRIRAIEDWGGPVPPHRYVCPGFIDLQVNGFGGVDFNVASLPDAAAERAARALLAHGTTRALATLITAGPDELCARASRLREARASSAIVREVFAGIHLEGPFLCPEDGPRGAHPREHCRPPDYDEFRALQKASGGAVRMLTLAPELPGALGLIDALHREGVLVAIGHHQADDATIDAAVRAGAVLCTHLGNGCHATLPRLANYVQTQLAEDRLLASFIADGFHIPPGTLKNFIRAKGVERSILVTDAVGPAAAIGDDYVLPFDDVEVLPDGRVVLPGTAFLAGSTLTMPNAVANVAKWAGCTRAEAVRMATRNPADFIGRRDLGRLEIDAVSDLVIIDWNKRLAVRETYLAGELAWSDKAAPPVA